VHTCSYGGLFAVPPVYPGITDYIPSTLENIASVHQKDPLAMVAISTSLLFLLLILVFENLL